MLKKGLCFPAQFLCCVARGLPVVSPAWIAESRKAGLFLDPWTFLLRDEANEKKLGFKLEATLHQVRGHILAIYGPMIYTAPQIMFRCGKHSLRGQVGGGRDFFLPFEMASLGECHLGPKKSIFPGPYRLCFSHFKGCGFSIRLS